MDKNRVFGIFVCMLLLIGTVLPVSGTMASKTPSQNLMQGNILYVGGIGPNNYSKIQDAIDNASDGDTVFVFDDSSPYMENIMIDTSIILRGEDKNTTIIDGGHQSHGVNITADTVTVRGFTIRNCDGNESGLEAGIVVSSRYNQITDNILIDNLCGITNFYNLVLPTNTGQNVITKNRFIRDGAGIWLINTSDNTIQGNFISECESGIFIMVGIRTNISFNIISENENGIFVMISYNTTIYRNNISYSNNIGLFMTGGNGDKILQNNFIGNNRSAISTQRYPPNIKMWMKLNLPVYRRNVWKGNYWDEPRSTPYMIPGVFLKFRFHFDWHPAQVPYEIPVMS